MSAVAQTHAATVKHPDDMAPLIQAIDELRGVAGLAARADLEARLRMLRARVNDPRVRLAVVGDPKSGMSSLVNALVGAAISATEAPMSVPVIVEYGPQPSATLVRATGDARPERLPVDPLNPAPALNASSVIRVEFTQPSAFLAEGVVLMDAPGTPTHEHTTWSMIAAADAVLYVADAGTELSPAQLDQLQRIHQICPTVVCVLNKLDRAPHWAHTQQRDRELLDATGLGFAVAPVAAGSSGGYRHDVDSGVPQLIEHLRKSVIGRADLVARTTTAEDLRLIIDHLALELRTEAERLRDPRARATAIAQLTAARDQAEQLRQSTASWQIALADGSTELSADIEHDLRHRLRTVVRDTEAEISRTDPVPQWGDIDSDLQERVDTAVQENFTLAAERAGELSESLAAKFPADHRTPPVPDLRAATVGVLDSVAPLDQLETARIGTLALLLASLRGSYGGILMVGLVTSLLDMSLVNWYSGGFGILLGAHSLWEELKNRRQRRQAEAKTAVARRVDDAIFQVGKQSRAQLRLVQRTLRDHFTDIATEIQTAADTALRRAEETGAKYGDGGAARLTDIDSALGTLRDIRQRTEKFAA